MGTSRQSGHLLDFSIGQYDTYTPIQLSQYINTIANGGTRLKPFLLKAVYSPTKDGLTDLLYKNTTEPIIIHPNNTIPNNTINKYFLINTTFSLLLYYCTIIFFYTIIKHLYIFIFYYLYIFLL